MQKRFERFIVWIRMNGLSVMQIILTSLAGVLLSWIVPQKVVAPKRSPVSPFPTVVISPFVTMSPTQEPFANNEFIYPNAQITTNPDGLYALSSTDDPNQITRWYKEKIAAAGMHSTSVSQTNSNNNILNVLDASSNLQEVKITIERPADEQNTTISVRVISK